MSGQVLILPALRRMSPDEAGVSVHCRIVEQRFADLSALASVEGLHPHEYAAFLLSHAIDKAVETMRGSTGDAPCQK